MTIPIIKTVPNISHIPRTEKELNAVLQFLKTPRDRTQFYEFLRSKLIKTRNFELTSRKDSTERKWMNHLHKLGLINVSRTKISNSQLSNDYLNHKLRINDLILETFRTYNETTILLNDLIIISYYIDSYASVPDLYSSMTYHLDYISRNVSAERNLTGILKYMSIGQALKKDKGVKFISAPFLELSKRKLLQEALLKFIYSNGTYAGYASVNKASEFLSNEYKISKLQADLFIKGQVDANPSQFLLQKASSNKEIGIFIQGKNILFIRLTK